MSIIDKIIKLSNEISDKRKGDYYIFPSQNRLEWLKEFRVRNDYKEGKITKAEAFLELL